MDKDKILQCILENCPRMDIYADTDSCYNTFLSFDIWQDGEYIRVDDLIKFFTKGSF